MIRLLRLFALILAGEMIYGLAFHIPRFFRPTLLDGFDLTNTQLGDMFAAYGVVAMFSYLIGGPFADRYPTRNLIAASLIMTALGGFYMATLPSAFGMTLAYAAWGFSTSFFFWAALIKATRDWGGSLSQGRAFGFLDGGRGLAAAVLGTLAVWILAQTLPDNPAAVTDVDRVDALQRIILYYSVIALLCAAIVWVLVPHDEDTVNTTRNPFLGFQDVAGKPVVWAQALIIVCAYCGYKGSDNFGLYADQVLGFSEEDSAWLTNVGAYVRPIAAVAAGLIADRFDSARSIGVLFASLIVTFGLLMFLTPDNATTMVITVNLFITFAAIFGLRGIYYALLEETQIPKHLTGASVAIIAFVGYTPDAFFGPITGRILDASPGVQGHLNYFAFLTAIAVIGLLMTLWLIWLKRRSAVN